MDHFVLSCHTSLSMKGSVCFLGMQLGSQNQRGVVYNVQHSPDQFVYVCWTFPLYQAELFKEVITQVV